jgi:hypothetical protein
MEPEPAPDPFTELLQEQGVVVLDGALGTQLEALGGELDAVLWSASLVLDNPDLIKQVWCALSPRRDGPSIAWLQPLCMYTYRVWPWP